MNKQEAIEKVKTMTVETFFSGTLFVKQQEVIAIIEQIGEPTSGCAEEAKKSNKVVIPQFVAEWIEYCKKNNLTIAGAFDPVSEHGIGLAETYGGNVYGCTRWTLDNQDIFARAWLDGYEVEKEKMYTARLKINGKERDSYINRVIESGEIYLSNLTSIEGKLQVHFTQTELKELYYWNNPAFEIEEVE